MQASDIMCTPVFSVAPDTPVKEIAALLLEKRISGVPVVDEGRLLRPATVRVTPPADQAICGRLQAELERQFWWRQTASNVIVTDGVVHYHRAGDFPSPPRRTSRRSRSPCRRSQ